MNLDSPTPWLILLSLCQNVTQVFYYVTSGIMPISAMDTLGWGSLDNYSQLLRYARLGIERIAKVRVIPPFSSCVFVVGTTGL